jgi:DNA-binding TFAR19-related protein (PDSD5 family)
MMDVQRQMDVKFNQYQMEHQIVLEMEARNRQVLAIVLEMEARNRQVIAIVTVVGKVIVMLIVIVTS